MNGGEIAAAAAVFALAGALLVLAVRHFLERGFLLNNAYIYASREERKTMDKKPYYRQSAVVFCLLSAVFTVVGLSLVLRKDGLLLLELPLAAGAVVYAIVSSLRLSRVPKK